VVTRPRSNPAIHHAPEVPLAKPVSAIPRGPLASVRREAADCHACPLWRGATRTVFGEGPAHATVMLIGEQPGAQEDLEGRPFVGPAGQLLDELLHSIGWAREDVFITNVVKCRPPGNRDPEPEEIGACAEFLDRQQRILDPAVIVTLGRFSLQRYLPGARISSIHGQVKRVGGRAVFPMYHPAAALRADGLRETLFRDIRALPAALLAARQALEEERAQPANRIEQRAAEEARPADDQQQLTLF
jgi:DNA polymerase